MRSYEFLLLAVLVLACPLAMWLMMRGHHGADRDDHRQDSRADQRRGPRAT